MHNSDSESTSFDIWWQSCFCELPSEACMTKMALGPLMQVCYGLRPLSSALLCPHSHRLWRSNLISPCVCKPKFLELHDSIIWFIFVSSSTKKINKSYLCCRIFSKLYLANLGWLYILSRGSSEPSRFKKCTQNFVFLLCNFIFH